MMLSTVCCCWALSRGMRPGKWSEREECYHGKLSEKQIESKGSLSWFFWKRWLLERGRKTRNWAITLAWRTREAFSDGGCNRNFARKTGRKRLFSYINKRKTISEKWSLAEKVSTFSKEVWSWALTHVQPRNSVLLCKFTATPTSRNIWFSSVHSLLQINVPLITLCSIDDPFGTFLYFHPVPGLFINL